MIFLGITDDGIVKGIKLNYKSNDELYLDIQN
jgi:hypothetical protein